MEWSLYYIFHKYINKIFGIRERLWFNMLVLKKIGKIVKCFFLILLSVLLLGVLVIFIVNKIATAKEMSMLEKEGYLKLVSVGDYSLNVYDYGNKQGKHTLVFISGQGVHDYSITMSKVSDQLAVDNRIVYVDRAGYGLSEDTKVPQTNENIVNDYRTALKNAGIEGPYILIPHSLGGAYATYWQSNYPEEIEGVVFVDCTELNENVFFDDETPAFESNAQTALCKLGFFRLAVDYYFDPLPNNYTDKEKEISHALNVRNGWSNAAASEEKYASQNCISAFKDCKTNDIPKVYISSSNAHLTKECIIEELEWSNQILAKGAEPQSLTDEFIEERLKAEEVQRETVLKPYLKKMGNCDLVLLGGSHDIYMQKPDEVAQIIKDFIAGIE